MTSKSLTDKYVISNKEDIFTNLDFEIPEMEALMDIFQDIWPFTYKQEKKQIIAPIPKEQEWEHEYNWIKFFFIKK